MSSSKQEPELDKLSSPPLEQVKLDTDPDEGSSTIRSEDNQVSQTIFTCSRDRSLVLKQPFFNHTRFDGPPATPCLSFTDIAFQTEISEMDADGYGLFVLSPTQEILIFFTNISFQDDIKISKGKADKGEISETDEDGYGLFVRLPTYHFLVSIANTPFQDDVGNVSKVEADKGEASETDDDDGLSFGLSVQSPT